MKAHPSRPEELDTMDSTGSASADPRRADVYLAAVEAAEAEAREIDGEIMLLEGRAAAMRGRVGSLRALSEALRALVPTQRHRSAQTELPYVPVEILDSPVESVRVVCR